MKADVVGINWVEFTVLRMIGLSTVFKETIIGEKVEETEYTVTVQYLWDGEERLIVLEK